jgi:hypothetical protein
LHNVWRHYLPAGALLGIGVGALVDRVARLGRPVALAVLAIVAEVQVFSLDWPPGAYEDDVGRVAARLRALQAKLGGRILVEGVGFDSRVIQILVGDMDIPVFDRLIWLVPLDRPMTQAERDENRSLLEKPFGEVSATLDRDHVHLLAVYTDEARERAKAFGTEVYIEPERREGEADARSADRTDDAAVDRGFSREEGRWTILRRGR